MSCYKGYMPNYGQKYQFQGQPNATEATPPTETGTGRGAAISPALPAPAPAGCQPGTMGPSYVPAPPNAAPGTTGPSYAPAPGFTPTTVENPYFLAGYLQNYIGRKVRIEFLVGTTTMTDRTGTLLTVGASYVVIQPIDSDDLMICDLYSIKFVTVIL